VWAIGVVAASLAVFSDFRRRATAHVTEEPPPGGTQHRRLRDRLLRRSLFRPTPSRYPLASAGDRIRSHRARRRATGAEQRKRAPKSRVSSHAASPGPHDDSDRAIWAGGRRPHRLSQERRSAGHCVEAKGRRRRHGGQSGGVCPFWTFMAPVVRRAAATLGASSAARAMPKPARHRTQSQRREFAMLNLVSRS